MTGLPRSAGGAVGVTAGNAGVDMSGLLRPVREGNAFEETVERLLTVIKLGVVGPGDRFPPERELAAHLGISRLTLREAIRELSKAGYVESKRGRLGGTFITYSRPEPSVTELGVVAHQHAEKLTDALAFRFAVETGAADMLAQQIMAGRAGVPTRQPVGVIAAGAPAGDEPPSSKRDTLLTRLEEVNRASPQDYRRMDTKFHLAIAELTGSSLLTAACADARMRLNDLLNAIPVLKLNISHAATQHQEITEAILAGDPERARAAVAEHLAGTGSLLRGFLG